MCQEPRLSLKELIYGPWWPSHVLDIVDDDGLLEQGEDDIPWMEEE